MGHTYHPTSYPHTYGARLTVTDNGYSTAFKLYTVTVPASAVTINAATPVMANTTVTYQATADTNCADKTLNYTMDFGDGSPHQTGSFNSYGAPPLSFIHAYHPAVYPQTYTAHLTVTDTGGGSSTKDIPVTFTGH